MCTCAQYLMGNLSCAITKATFLVLGSPFWSCQLAETWVFVLLVPVTSFLKNAGVLSEGQAICREWWNRFVFPSRFPTDLPTDLPNRSLHMKPKSNTLSVWLDRGRVLCQQVSVHKRLPARSAGRFGIYRIHSGAHSSIYSHHFSCCQTRELFDKPWRARQPITAPHRPAMRQCCNMSNCAHLAIWQMMLSRYSSFWLHFKDFSLSSTQITFSLGDFRLECCRELYHMVDFPLFVWRLK